MTIVAGKVQKQERPIDRIHKAYREGVIEFADTYGFQHDEVANVFEQLMFMRMHEQRWPKNLAAWQAMHDVRAFLYTPGAEDAN